VERHSLLPRWETFAYTGTQRDRGMEEVGRWLLLLWGSLLSAGTLAGFSSNPHWSVRLWDFPRAQIAIAALATGVGYYVCCHEGQPLDWAFVAVVAATFAWQTWKILPYTPLAPRRVQRSDDPTAPRIRLLITNVKMENQAHDLVLQAIEEADPDVVLALETDEAWTRALAPLARRYPHSVRQPQDNWYGMVLLSRLPLLEAGVRFMVQDDIPSVHAVVQLADGSRVYLHGLHPRPPEPIRDQDSTPRDAELVVMAKAIREAGPRPTIVAGDLNDVAWSPTSELFLRLSGLLDPRLGRGMYNSFDATNPLFRYPLDHVFHSTHFRLVQLRRCGKVGSDHFPMLVELALQPEATADQEPSQPEPGDHAEAAEKIEKQAEAAATGEDRPRDG
jgi:endonuclease/exonuclease/phosphatase (EEP) superfamily protein YafD